MATVLNGSGPTTLFQETSREQKPQFPGIPTTSDRAYFMVCAVVFVVAAIGVLAIRRGPFGRKLVAVNDSPAACATLGMNVNGTKLVAFTVSAGMAGLAGVLYGGSPGAVSASDFAFLVSLTVLLLARVGGINTASGALLGAATLTAFNIAAPHVAQLGELQYLLTGLAAVSIGRGPNGITGRVIDAVDALRARPRVTRMVAAAGTPAAAFIAEEGDSLVGAAR